jgi:hypothetical protein
MMELSRRRAWAEVATRAAGLALLGLSLAASPLARPPAAEATQFDQGLQDGWAFDNRGNTAGTDLLSEQFGHMQQAGAGWVRIHFRLGDCFSAWETPGCRPDGKTALQLSEEVVDLALAHDLKVLGLLTHESWRGGGQAEWNENNVENGGADGDNPYIRDLAARAASPLAARFRGKVDAWELWTKPNAWTDSAGTTYAGGTFIYPSNYAQLLRQVGAAIKAANPEATFISGGLLGHDVGAKHQGLQGTYAGRPAGCPSTLPSGGEYLCAIYAMGRARAGWTAGASPFDHVGQHLYIRQSTAVTRAELVAYLEDLRRVYLAYGGEPPSKQTHVTAFGWTTAPFGSTTAFVSPEQQAQNLETAYRTFHDLSPARGGYVARAYWFRTRDAERPPSYPDYFDYFGLADPQGTPKPAFGAYQRDAAY